MSEPRILIIDGTNTFLRNYAVNPTMDTNGKPIGGLVGTLRSVKFMIRETNASRVFFVWDGEGGSKRRKGIFSEYKAGRKPRLNREFDHGDIQEGRQNIEWQMQKTKDLLEHLGVTQLVIQDVEADDVIGYLVGYLDPQPKVVVSSDKDMWQLVSNTTCVYWPTKEKYITTGNFAEVTEFPPYNYVLVRAMRGAADNADNISGLKGLGDKTIKKIFGPDLELPITLDELVEKVEWYLKLDSDGKKKLKPTEKRWYKALVDGKDLVKQNVQLMQLSSPIISANSAAIIRGAADSRPVFQFTAFKLALLNNGIQLTDADLMLTFKALQARTSNAAR